MNLTPRGIRQHLGMNAPIYAPSAAYGHFGRAAGEAGAGTLAGKRPILVDAENSACLMPVLSDSKTATLKTVYLPT